MRSQLAKRGRRELTSLGKGATRDKSIAGIGSCGSPGWTWVHKLFVRE